MKKLSLLLGTLGGATAGYLFSNKKLREQLSNAKDAEEAARLLGKALQKDGKKLASQVQEFIESDDVQKNITKAKQYAKKTVDEAKKELEDVISSGKKSMKKATKKAGAKAKKTVKKKTAAAKKTVKKTASKAKKTANKAARRMKTNVRKVS